MNRQKNMRDTHVKNIRLNSPLGLLGVPPDQTAAVELVNISTRGGGKYG